MPEETIALSLSSYAAPAVVELLDCGVLVGTFSVGDATTTVAVGEMGVALGTTDVAVAGFAVCVGRVMGVAVDWTRVAMGASGVGLAAGVFVKTVVGEAVEMVAV